MTERLTEAQIDEIEKLALQPNRRMELPTSLVRRMLEEIRNQRDAVCMLQMKIDGGKAIVDAVVAAARADVDTKLSSIQIERPNGPPFYLVEAIRSTGDAS